MYPAELPPHVRPAPQEHRTIGRLVTQGLLEPDPHFGRDGVGGTVLELGRRLIHVYRDDQGAHLDSASSLPERSRAVGSSRGRWTHRGLSAPPRSPPRPECAVTRLSTPATMAAAVNRNPIICADSGTTRSLGSGLVAARSNRRARAFTNRTSLMGGARLRRTHLENPAQRVEEGGVPGVVEPRRHRRRSDYRAGARRATRRGGRATFRYTPPQVARTFSFLRVLAGQGATCIT